MTEAWPPAPASESRVRIGHADAELLDAVNRGGNDRAQTADGLVGDVNAVERDRRWSLREPATSPVGVESGWMRNRSLACRVSAGKSGISRPAITLPTVESVVCNSTPAAAVTSTTCCTSPIIQRNGNCVGLGHVHFEVVDACLAESSADVDGVYARRNRREDRLPPSSVPAL